MDSQYSTTLTCAPQVAIRESHVRSVVEAIATRASPFDSSAWHVRCNSVSTWERKTKASRLLKARPGDHVEAVNDGESALAILREYGVDVLIADIRMPGMSGIELVLKARSIYPDLPVIVMTAFQSADVERLNGSAFTGFLEKPFEFEILRAMVEEALAPKDVGFSGAISVQTLPDVVQLYVLSSTTGALTIRHRGEDGVVYFAQGSILHAATSSQRGDDAFYEIMMWSGGEFSMRLGSMAPEQSVTSNWQELLMESVRRIDESRRGDAPPSTGAGWTLAPPPSNDDVDFAIDFAMGDLPPKDLVAPAAVSDSQLTTTNKKEITMNIKESLGKLNQIDGFVGAALVDSESGMLLGQEGGGNINLEVAAAGNTEVVRAKRKTMNNLGLKEGIEDILITLTKQYHLIRPLRGRPTLFFYVALDRSRANLAMARIGLADVEKDLQV